MALLADGFRVVRDEKDGVCPGPKLSHPSDCGPRGAAWIQRRRAGSAGRSILPGRVTE